MDLEIKLNYLQSMSGRNQNKNFNYSTQTSKLIVSNFDGHRRNYQREGSGHMDRENK